MIVVDLDDIHPERGFLTPGDLPSRVLSKILSKFPNIKVTLFVTPDWIFKSQIPLHKFNISLSKRLLRSYKKGTFQLNNHLKWCRWINNFFPKQVSIAVHGLYHFQTVYPYGAEFQNLSYQEAISRIEIAENIFNSAGIKFQKVFRPPGWEISSEAEKAVKDFGYFLASREITNCDISKSSVEDIKLVLERNRLAVLHGHISKWCDFNKTGNGLIEGYMHLIQLFNELKDEEYVSFPNH